MPDDFEQVDLSKPVDAAERRLLSYLEDLRKEGDRAKSRWIKKERLERDLQLYRGEIKHRENPFFEMNIVPVCVSQCVFVSLKVCVSLSV